MPWALDLIWNEGENHKVNDEDFGLFNCWSTMDATLKEKESSSLFLVCLGARTNVNIIPIPVLPEGEILKIQFLEVYIRLVVLGRLFALGKAFGDDSSNQGIFGKCKRRCS